MLLDLDHWPTDRARMLAALRCMVPACPVAVVCSDGLKVAEVKALADQGVVVFNCLAPAIFLTLHSLYSLGHLWRQHHLSPEGMTGMVPSTD